jgi:hypothetical protein
MYSQGFLFAEPSISDVAVWTQLRDGIDPADWAFLCRCLGNLEPQQLYGVLSQVKGRRRSHQTPKLNLNDKAGIPLVSIGCSGLGANTNGRYKS